MAVSEVTIPTTYRQLDWIDGYRFGSDGAIQSRRKCNRWGGYTDEWRDVYFRRTKDGHLSVRITVGGKKRKFFVHRLILEAFAGPCPPGMECLHRDDDPSNNRVGNLRWGTRRENIEDSKRNGKFVRARGSRQHMAKLTEDDIPFVRMLLAEGVSHENIAKCFNVSRPAISFVSRGETWAHVQ